MWETSQRHHGRRFSLTQASFPSLLLLTLNGGSAVLPQPLKWRDSTLGGSTLYVYRRLTAKKDWDRLLPGRAQGNLESDGNWQSRSRFQFRQLPQIFHPHLNVLDLWKASLVLQEPVHERWRFGQVPQERGAHFQVSLLRMIDDVAFGHMVQLLYDRSGWSIHCHKIPVRLGLTFPYIGRTSQGYWEQYFHTSRPVHQCMAIPGFM
jgi:hypothetical protein